MIDHFNLPVTDIARSTRFYEQVLNCLDLNIVVKEDDAVGFGIDNWTFGIVQESGPIPPIHVAFAAENRAQVDRFFELACAAGASSNGAPGLRPEYGPAYYAAFVRDPDGHNVEAVCRHHTQNAG